jgi:crotonobetainyl-CoA:carnitine CoA-transferase CaiB-like acyl-CoA transferase
MSPAPLAGLKVLDLTRLLPGGFCTLLFADLGAEVLKVEDTAAGDYLRWMPPHVEGVDRSAGSALFLSLNRNKRSVRIDLRNEAGREVFERLVASHDVLIESFRPGVLDRLGVGFERLREVNPGLIYCAISGYGQDGPKAGAPGHDINYLALVGMLSLTGERDGPPVLSAGQIADLGGGAMMAAFAVMAALRERDGGSGVQGSGEGQLVDISMADGALSWLAFPAAEYFATGQAPARGEPLLAGAVICYRPYRCADGWVALGALEPKFWQAFCTGVGREDLVGAQYEHPGSDAHAALEQIFVGRTRAQWQQFAAEHECCLEPVLDLDQALQSDLVRAREMVVEVPQPGAARALRQLGSPIKLARTPAEPARAPAPALGQHTLAVLGELGYTQGEIETMEQAGAVAGAWVAKDIS